jgi:hypothetical protein
LRERRRISASLIPLPQPPQPVIERQVAAKSKMSVALRMVRFAEEPAGEREFGSSRGMSSASVKNL